MSERVFADEFHKGFFGFFRLSNEGDFLAFIEEREEKL